MQNLVWEFCIAALFIALGRVFRATTGQPMTAKQELIFWAAGIVFLTAVLAIVNVRFVAPLRQAKHIPNFKCEITDVIVGIRGSPGMPNVSDQTQRTQSLPTGVTLLVTIVNSGAPSIAWKWKLKIKLASGHVREAVALTGPSNATLVSEVGNKPITLTTDRYLPNRLLESPVSTGSAKVGWVSFQFDNITHDEIKRIGTEFVVEFQDSEGRTTTATCSMETSGRLL